MHPSNLGWEPMRGLVLINALPSVRSLIDYLMMHVPAWLKERSI